MSTDNNSPAQALELVANIVLDISTELHRDEWEGDVNNADIPESVLWAQEYPISRTVIRYLGEEEIWGYDVEQAVRRVLPRHNQAIVKSSFHETRTTFMRILESDYVKVVIENDR